MKSHWKYKEIDYYVFVELLLYCSHQWEFSNARVKDMQIGLSEP